LINDQVYNKDLRTHIEIPQNLTTNQLSSIQKLNACQNDEECLRRAREGNMDLLHNKKSNEILDEKKDLPEGTRNINGENPTILDKIADVMVDVYDKTQEFIFGHKDEVKTQDIPTMEMRGNLGKDRPSEEASTLKGKEKQ